MNIILKKSDTGHGNYIEMIGNFKRNVCFNFNLSDRQVAGAENKYTQYTSFKRNTMTVVAQVKVPELFQKLKREAFNIVV